MQEHALCYTFQVKWHPKPLSDSLARRTSSWLDFLSNLSASGRERSWKLDFNLPSAHKLLLSELLDVSSVYESEVTHSYTHVQPTSDLIENARECPICVFNNVGQDRKLCCLVAMLSN